jgi:hypothetical protein
VGVSLAVTPKISVDGKVLMRVEPIVSAVSNTTVPIGNGLTAPAIDTQNVTTTILANDGETVVLGGLISKRDLKTENKIPWFGDLPCVGALFRARFQTKQRRELLIILTPHIIRGRTDAQRILAEESRRMDWAIGDILKIHGTYGMAPILPPPVPGPGMAFDGGPAISPHLPGDSDQLPLPTPVAPAPEKQAGTLVPPPPPPPATSNTSRAIPPALPPQAAAAPIANLDGTALNPGRGANR